MTRHWLILLGALAMASPAQTPQKVIDEYIRARGGSKALTQIHTETLAGSLSEEATGKTGSFSLITKAPNRFYREIIVEPDRAVEAYNGMSRWGQNYQEGTRTLTGAAAKEAEAAGRFTRSSSIPRRTSSCGKPRLSSRSITTTTGRSTGFKRRIGSTCAAAAASIGSP